MEKDILHTICDYKRDHVQYRNRMFPLKEVEHFARHAPPPRGFARALDARTKSGGFGLIAEIKKASPSAGEIRSDITPTQAARAYEKGGAACLSVLTDEKFFNGNDRNMVEASAACNLPVLRKDFIVSSYQIHEFRALGADCILLIMAALSDTDAAEFCALAHAYKMDVLAEVHNAEEMGRALKLSADLIGINNRDLKTMNVDLAVTEQLAPLVPPGKSIVCESGLATNADLQRMSRAGVRRFLIGQALMSQPDIEAATRAILGR